MQILIFLVLLLIVGAIFYAKHETLSFSSKIGLIALFIIILGSGWWYEKRSSEKSEQNRIVISAFKQGKTLFCEGREVDNETFIFVSGTLSFIPNEQNQNDKGVIIDISKCKLEK